MPINLNNCDFDLLDRMLKNPDIIRACNFEINEAYKIGFSKHRGEPFKDIAQNIIDPSYDVFIFDRFTLEDFKKVVISRKFLNEIFYKNDVFVKKNVVFFIEKFLENEFTLEEKMKKYLNKIQFRKLDI